MIKIVLHFELSFYVSLGREMVLKWLKTSGRPTCFAANNEGFGRNR